MYREPLKTAVTEALRQTFADNPTPEWRDVYVGIEFPMEKQHYPGIWVQYDDRESVKIVGIDHSEMYVNPDGTYKPLTRWTFSGTITLTIVALTSLERDRLFDELVRVYAFARVEDNQTVFRDKVENHDLIGVTLNWDEVRPSGDSAAPGTPWGTEDDVIYEQSISFDVARGEFLSTPSVSNLLPLREIQIVATEVNADGEPVEQIVSVVDADTPLWGPAV